MENDCQVPHGPDLFSQIQNPNAQIVILTRSVQKILVASVNRHKQVFVKAEIATPDSVVGDMISVHNSSQYSTLDLQRLFDLTRLILTQ